MSEISIALDAGHGGSDPGATYKGRQEKDDTLRLVQAIGKILEDNGINVFYTRTDDIYETPFKKASDANNAGVDYFVSIHRNSSERENQYTGVETLVYDESGIKADMARNVNSELEAAGFKNLGITERPNLVVLKRTQMPAILVEVGFINNDQDNALLDNNFNRIAEAIADGILETIYQNTSDGSRITSIDDSTEIINGDAAFEPDTLNEMLKETDSYSDDSEIERPRPEENDYPDIDQYYNTNNNQLNNTPMMEEDNFNQGQMPSMRGYTPSTNEPNSRDALYYNIRVPESQGTYSNGEPLYRVQVGAYKNKNNAERMLNSLLIEGFPAFIVYEDNLYKVQVGAFRYLANAVKMERRLRRFRYNTFIVYA